MFGCFGITGVLYTLILFQSTVHAHIHVVLLLFSLGKAALPLTALSLSPIISHCVALQGRTMLANPPLLPVDLSAFHITLDISKQISEMLSQSHESQLSDTAQGTDRWYRTLLLFGYEKCAGGTDSSWDHRISLAALCRPFSSPSSDHG
jgi:hypothetical protein